MAETLLSNSFPPTVRPGGQACTKQSVSTLAMHVVLDCSSVLQENAWRADIVGGLAQDTARCRLRFDTWKRVAVSSMSSILG